MVMVEVNGIKGGGSWSFFLTTK